MTIPMRHAAVETAEELLGLYDPPSPVALGKVLARFDRHSRAFIGAARFAALDVRAGDGRPTPVLTGGSNGFARVVDDATVEIVAPAPVWTAAGLEISPREVDVGAMFVIPGIKETLRCKGRASTSRVGGDVVVRLRIANAFFHCAKAFMRSRIWDPPDPDRWKGLREFRCIAKEKESEVITSFLLAPADGGPAPRFRPGQHVAIEFDLGAEGATARRAYSLSNRPGETALRISVRRETHPAAASGFLHDHVHVGDVVGMRNPSGEFVLDEGSSRPVVLLSAGVGLTPMVSMLDHLVACGSPRGVWFVHAATSGREHAMGRHVRAVARANPNVHVHVRYARPRPEDVLGRDHDAEGRFAVEDFKRMLPWDDYEFYVCGPVAFMQAAIDGLLANGVLPERVRWEAFSARRPKVAGSARTDAAPAISSGDDAITETGMATVEFRRSGKRVAWSPEQGTLLDLAEANGVRVRSGCRTGGCFTCGTRLLSGRVSYAQALEDEPLDGTVLICSATPAGDVALDL